MPDKTSPEVKTARMRLLIIAFTTGAALMSLEIAGSRILAPVFGSGIYVWGSLISVFIGSLAVGYYLGGKIADMWPSFLPLGIAAGVAGVYHLALPVIEVGIFNFMGLERAVGSRWTVLFTAILLFTFPSVLLGCISPMAVRLSARRIEEIGNISGKLYAVSTLGSLFGTLLTAFVLIPEPALGIRGILHLLGFVLLAVAALAIIPMRKKAGKGRAALVAFFLAGGLLLIPCPEPNVTLYPTERLLHLEDSVYHRIAVVDDPGMVDNWEKSYEMDGCFYRPRNALTREGYLRPVYGENATGTRYLYFNNYRESAIFLDTRTYFYNRMNMPGIEVPVFPSACNYTDQLWLPLIWNPGVKNVVFIGGGGGVVPRMYLAKFPAMRADLVELDPAIVRVAREYFYLDEAEFPDGQGGSRLGIHCVDGRQYFKREHSEPYDLVVLDAFSAAGQIPFHLTTLEYIREIKEHMTEDGILLWNIISVLDGPEGLVFQHAYRTLAEEFAQVYVFPKWVGFDDIDYTESNNIILICTNEKTRRSLTDIVQSAVETQNELSIPIPSFVKQASSCVRMERLEKILWDDVQPLTDDWAPIDTWAY